MKKFFIVPAAIFAAFSAENLSANAVPAPIFAQSFLLGNDNFEESQATKIEIFPSEKSVPAGEKFSLFVKISMPKNWHIYWKNPGEVGDVLRIEWENLPPEISLKNWRWSAPKFHEQDGLKNFVLEDEAFVEIPVEISPNFSGEKIEFRGNAEWLACNEDSCVPQSGSVSAAILISENRVSANEEISEIAEKSFPKISEKISAKAEFFGNDEGKISLKISGIPVAGMAKFFPENPEISPEISSASKTISPAGTAIFEIFSEQKIDEVRGVLKTENGDFEISAVPEKAFENAASGTTSEENFAAGTTKNSDEISKNSSGPPGFEWLDWSLEKQDEILASGKIVYVDFTARWCATCQVNKRVYADETLRKRFAEAGVVLMRADWTKPNPEIAAELKKYNRAAVPFNVFKKQNSPDFVLPSAFAGAGTLIDALEKFEKGEVVPAENSDENSAGTPLVALAGLAFLGGLILNLMPCVFPVLGLKIMNFVGKSGSEKRKIFAHGIVFALGVLVSFWILAGILIALRSGGEQLGWGFQMQSPHFVFGMILLLFVFGLSMSGVFEFGAKATSVGGNLTEKTGFAGSFFSGVLAVVVATPCAAPFLAPALGSALSLPPLPSLCIFTFIALGLAFPYVLLSSVPELLKFLPKPGAWMESFKQLMAFLLYAPAAYFVWVLLGQIDDPFAQRDLILSLSIIALSCWIYGRWCVPWRSLKARIAAGTIAFVLFSGTIIYDLSLL